MSYEYFLPFNIFLISCFDENSAMYTLQKEPVNTPACVLFCHWTVHIPWELSFNRKLENTAQISSEMQATTLF